MYISQVETLENLGFMLGRYREERGLTLHDVASALHVRAKYLQAMEAGNFSELPGTAYVRGYLQNYAEFLGLSRDEVFKAFVRINEARRASQNFFLPKVLSRDTKPSQGLAIISLALALAFYAMWSVVQHKNLPGETARVIAQVNESVPASEAATPKPAVHRCMSDRQEAFPPCYAHVFEERPLLLVPSQEAQSALEVVRQLQQQGGSNGS